MLQEIVAVIIAIAAWDLACKGWDYLHRKPDLKCDGCQAVKKLYKIKSQNLYYCHKCKKIYLTEQRNNAIIEQ